MRQRREFPKRLLLFGFSGGWWEEIECRVGALAQSSQYGDSSIRPSADELKSHLTATRGTRIGKIDDVALIAPFNRSVRRVEKALEVFREPVIAARFAAILIHPLLHHAPASVRAHDERVQVQIKAILHCGAIDLRHEAARACERYGIKTRAFADLDELRWRAARMPPASAANEKAKLGLQRP